VQELAALVEHALFDDLISLQQERRWNRRAERLAASATSLRLDIRRQPMLDGRLSHALSLSKEDCSAEHMNGLCACSGHGREGALQLCRAVRTPTAINLVPADP
jgi:hypothetical protein